MRKATQIALESRGRYMNPKQMSTAIHPTPPLKSKFSPREAPESGERQGGGSRGAAGQILRVRGCVATGNGRPRAIVHLDCTKSCIQIFNILCISFAGVELCIGAFGRHPKNNNDTKTRNHNLTLPTATAHGVTRTPPRTRTHQFTTTRPRLPSSPSPPALLERAPPRKGEGTCHRLRGTLFLLPRKTTKKTLAHNPVYDAAGPVALLLVREVLFRLDAAPPRVMLSFRRGPRYRRRRRGCASVPAPARARRARGPRHRRR
jgi:hypothetical protein